MQSTYVTVAGEVIKLTDLSGPEARLFESLAKRGREADPAHWSEFKQDALGAVLDLYDSRRVPRQEAVRTALYRVVRDLASRLMVAAGVARVPDYRDQLRELIEWDFSSRKDFCEAAGLSEAMLSHVLSGRKDLAIGTLTAALDRVGYQLRIVRYDAGRRGARAEPAKGPG